ncbi:MAG TPA: S-layer homology domain-containing protein [Thermoanaerobaculia bacterium]|nr:S-layer homology domain-containing protein [Thermoanaerobaculia bacterium]
MNRWQLNGIRIATLGNNLVTDNFIGTDATGSVGLGNGFAGVAVLFASSTGNTISGNVISGNSNGVSTAGPGDQGTQILTNLIGTNAAGTGAIPNGNGVLIGGGNNSISGNVVSGNSNSGVVIDSSNATGCVVTGNRIGTDATGMVALPNAHNGISISNTTDIEIGGTGPDDGNVISGNADQGVSISTSTDVRLEGNLIGTDATGLGPLGNGISGAPFGGVYLSDSSNCAIGSLFGGNTIAFNDGNGVTVFSFGATSGNTVRWNAIYDNAARPPSPGLGIDLGDDGPTANDFQDADGGVNGLQNYPIIESVTIGAADEEIVGRLNSTPSTTFQLDFYASPACSPRPQAYLQAVQMLGIAEATTDGNGDASFDVTFGPAIAAGSRITVTATDPNGNTSEMSQRLPFTISPRSGPSSGGTTVTVAGTDFQPSATLTIGGQAGAGVSVDSATQITASTPALAPGTINDVVVTNPDATAGTITGGWISDFLDVPDTNIFYSYVTRLVANGVTAGCGGGNYCVTASITRAQMAVFLLKGKLGVCYVPPAATGTVFADVPANGFAAAWIEDLSARGITGGCGGGNYCPAAPVTRAQMAVFLLKTSLGTAYAPPAASGTVFDDVPTGSFAADWIEDLSARNITAGCSVSPPLYCPSAPNTRGQMATFIVKTFRLP